MEQLMQRLHIIICLLTPPVNCVVIVACESDLEYETTRVTDVKRNTSTTLIADPKHEHSLYKVKRTKKNKHYTDCDDDTMLMELAMSQCTVSKYVAYK